MIFFSRKHQLTIIYFFSLLQEDEDGHLVVLTIIEELMSKTQDVFLDHFARLGVFSKVQTLMGTPGTSSEASGECSSEIVLKNFEEKMKDDSAEDAKEILQGKAYHWRDWSICRGRDCLYVWSDWAALELSNGSNGWFRFILDGKLATMYSSGSPENGNDSSGELKFCFRGFCFKLFIACEIVKIYIYLIFL